MRMSELFGQTLRQAPADTEVDSHRLLLRAAFIRQLASGIFSYLPLARRSLNKIENIIRQEMDAIGGQEITMPVVHAADIWKTTGRYYAIDAEMGRFKDRNERDMVLAMTHEEVVADLARKEINSYRQLPQMVYHLQTKWRDDARPRAGLIRVREFTMKDSYSLDADYEGLDKQYRAHYQAYFNIFNRCGLPVKTFKSDVGMMGGSMAHEFMYLTPVGEDTLFTCGSCGYAANKEVATFDKGAPGGAAQLPIERVETPATKTIEDLTKLLGIAAEDTAKAVFSVGEIDGEDKLVLAIVRGDMEVNEVKLANAAKAQKLRPAKDEEISASGAVAGYASPIGLENVLVIVDEAVETAANLVAGANEEGFHLRNVNCGRDYQPDLVADIVMARPGDPCRQCGAELQTSRGVEVGNIFKLGTRFTKALDANFLDAEGKVQHVVMGSYGIGVGRLLASIAEEHNDENGLVWPLSVAPYQVHLVVLAKGDSPARVAAEDLYRQLGEAGVEVLFDDRNENAGVKFNDADLFGIPLRLTVGDRGLKKGVVESKRRDAEQSDELPVAEVVEGVKQVLAQLAAELDAGVVAVEYQD